MNTIPISGNTYPVKAEIKALGGRWDGEAKVWRVPAEKAEEARKLVADAGSSSGSSQRERPHFRHCADCGAASQGYYRCRDCNLDRRQGGSRYMGGQSYHYTDASGRRRFVLGDDD